MLIAVPGWRNLFQPLTQPFILLSDRQWRAQSDVHSGDGWPAAGAAAPRFPLELSGGGSSSLYWV